MKKETVIFAALMLVGVLARVVYLGAVPDGYFRDEAFAGYHAWCILNCGEDLWGCHYPMYFISCGSGMNALGVYLMIPFIALFGCVPLALRLPQAIVACLSLWVFYLLIKRLFGEKAGLIGLFLLAVCPWHIMMSRWGLESNLAPGFLLFGFYFFILGCEKPKYLLLSALMYGLELYAYSATWIAVVPMLILMLVYGLSVRKIRFDRYFFGALGIYLVFLVPVVLFLLVNYNVIEPINTRFFSVPKMVVFRADDVEFDFIRNFSKFAKMVVFQNDGWPSSGIPRFGLCYIFSLPFILAGFAVVLRSAIVDMKKRVFSPLVPVLVWLFAALVMACLVKPAVVRNNFTWFCGIILMTAGVAYLCEHLKKTGAAVIALYALSFVWFQYTYYTEWNGQMAENFCAGLGNALESASKRDGDIYLECASGIGGYMYTAFYMKIPPKEFRESVVWQKFPAKYLRAEELGRYKFTDNMCDSKGYVSEERENLPRTPGKNTYIIYTRYRDVYERAGCKIEPHGVLAVAYR
ncbi:MAG: glycosyltransferase family 39 protein [Abditibacteriota bacterium]|nr:glycosyltransferase family 39 protein [Abditibacteriota bacterium]